MDLTFFPRLLCSTTSLYILHSSLPFVEVPEQLSPLRNVNIMSSKSGHKNRNK